MYFGRDILRFKFSYAAVTSVNVMPSNELGLLVNFGSHPKLEWQRFAHAERTNRQ
ncbi:hypothetical protein Pla52o_30930 [Novipirellula galeiformis]|uniref:Uncharacterized protein n=1 Tax=Novipirellula galeiformis TaxID=2528004 RepID=A0A5C6CDA8_9BACT|nr:hypothetical protein Pla52o_30930 [Novipirellula galeiformis]